MELLNKVRELEACADCLKKIRDGYVNDTPVMYLPANRALFNSTERTHVRACDACLKLAIELIRAE